MGESDVCDNLHVDEFLLLKIVEWAQKQGKSIAELNPYDIKQAVRSKT